MSFAIFGKIIKRETSIYKLYNFFSNVEDKGFEISDFVEACGERLAYKLIKILVKKKILVREGDYYKKGENFDYFLEYLRKRFERLRYFKDDFLNNLVKKWSKR